MHSKRPCIEVYTEGITASEGASREDQDPFAVFVSMLRRQYLGTDEVEQYNRMLLKRLVERGHINKSNIVWHNNMISKIYDLKTDHKGKIEYNPPKKAAASKNHEAVIYAPDTPPIEMLLLKDAIAKSKQMAI